MKILLITHKNSRVLTPLLESQHKIVGIVESAPIKKINFIKKLFRKIIFNSYGYLTKSPIILHTYAKKIKIPYYYMAKKQDPEFESWVQRLKPELIIVCSMPFLLNEKIINIAKYGAINLHPSYLPEYRGPNAYFWQYYDNKKRGGVTIHFIDPGIDTGNIIAQEQITISSGMKMDELRTKVYAAGVPLLLKSIDQIETNCVQSRKQPLQSPLPQAKSVKGDEYKKLIREKEWMIEELWHFFCGTENYLPNFMNISSMIKPYLQVNVLGYQKCSPKTEKITEVYKKGGIYIYACKDGEISFQIKWSLKQFLYNFLVN